MVTGWFEIGDKTYLFSEADDTKKLCWCNFLKKAKWLPVGTKTVVSGLISVRQTILKNSAGVIF